MQMILGMDGAFKEKKPKICSGFEQLCGTRLKTLRTLKIRTSGREVAWSGAGASRLCGENWAGVCHIAAQFQSARARSLRSGGHNRLL